MPRYAIRCDLGDDYNGTVYAGQVVNEPLEFEGGLAEVEVDDEETARKLATLHTHLEFAGPVDADVDEDVSEEDVSEEDVSEGDGSGEDATESPFDPAEHTIDELEDQLADGDYTTAEVDALAAAERDGKDREGALDAIDDAREE